MLLACHALPPTDPPARVCVFPCLFPHRQLAAFVEQASEERERFSLEIKQLKDEVDVLQSQAGAVRKLEDQVRRFKASLEGLEALKAQNTVRALGVCVSLSSWKWKWKPSWRSCIIV